MFPETWRKEEARKGGNQQGIEGTMTRQSQDVESLIITPTYHRESLLVRFLKQVRSQTYGSWRPLVIANRHVYCHLLGVLL